MMAVVHWDGGSDGWGTNFLDAVNWVGDVLPGPADTAVIGATGTTAAITLSGTATVAEIDSSRPLRIQGGTLSGARFEGSGAAQLVATSSGGTLSAVTLASDLDVSSGSITIRNGLTLDGATVRIGDRDGNNAAAVTFDGGTQTIDGTGDFVFGAHSSNRIFPRGTSASQDLTIGSGITIHGNYGSIEGSSSYPIRLVNQGTIAADAATPYAADLGYDQPAAGFYRRSFSAAVDRSAVIDPLPESAYKNYRWGFYLNYVFDGLAAGDDYRVRLHFVEDGYTSSGQRLMDVAFNGSTVQTGLDIYAEAGARFKALAKDFTVTADSAGKILASLVAKKDYVLLSAIEIFQGSTRVASSDAGGATPGIITIEPAVLVNEGSLAASNGDALTVAGTWTNLGSVTATGGTVNLAGAFTTADIGSLDGSRGTVNLTGILDNTAATLKLDDATGSLRLAGGSISGGRIETTGTAKLLPTSSGGALSAVTLASDLDVSSGSITVRNGLTLDRATVRIGDRAGNSTGYVNFVGGTQSLAGLGEIIFGASSWNSLMAYGAYNPGATPTETFTIGAGITIHGNAGRINDSSNSSYYPIRILNQGTIAADAATPYASDLGYEQPGAGYYTGSFSSAIDTSAVTDPLPESAYKNYRYGDNLNYVFNGLTAGAEYRVRLHFVEDGYTSSGQRLMDVAFNGTTVQAGLDIYAESGARYKALAKHFTVTADGTGTILASLVAKQDYALLSAIEIFSGATRVASSDAGGAATGTITIEPAELVNEGSLAASNGDALTVAGTWTNLGSVTATGGTVNLGGAFTTADIGSLDGSRGTVNLTGILDNIAATLKLDDATGSWRLASGGTVSGGRIEATGTAKLVATGGTLSGVTLASDLDVSSGSISVRNGLTLDRATVRIGDRSASTSGTVTFDGGTQSVAGTGAFLFGSSGNNLIRLNGSKYDWDAVPTEEVTFGTGITVHGAAGRIEGDTGYPIRFINQGTIAADGSLFFPTDLGYDRFWSGSSWTESTSNGIDLSGVPAPLATSAYQNNRYGGSFAYTIPGLTPGASYRVRLHVAEMYWNDSSRRAMNVDLNGGRVLENYDVLAEAGGKYKAVMREFTVAADEAGRIIASFAAVRDNAIIGAIEVLSGDTRVASIDCGGPTAGEIRVTPRAFSTTGTLAAVGGETLTIAPDKVAQWTNPGTILVDGGTLNAGALVNTSGTVTVARGTLAVSGDYVQTDGSTTLVNGTLDPSGVASIAAGTLSGSGTVKANLSSAGTMVIGRTGTAGTLSVEGTFTQAATGSLQLEIGGLPPKFSDSTAPAIAAETEPNDNGEPGFQQADLVTANDLSGSFVEMGGDQFEATVTGTISAGSDQDWDFFRVPLLAGDQLRIEMRGSAFNGGTLGDTYLHLYDGSGNRLASDDDSLGNLSSLITFVVPATGDYFIVADSYSQNTGSYTLVASVTRVGGVDSPNDRLRVTGAASLDGTLHVGMIGGYEVSTSGIPFDIVRYGSRSGAFDTVSGLSQGNGRSFTIDYRTDRVTLVSAVDDSAPPLLQSITPAGLVNRPVSSLHVVFNEPIDAATFTAADVRITTPSGVVDTASVTVTRINATDFDVVFPALDAEGAYTVEVGPDITDTAGNPMAEAVSSAFTIDRSGPRIVAVSPSGLVGSRLTAFEVTFDGAIDGASFTAADATLATPGDGTVAPSSVSRVSDTIYRITFPAQTAPGVYRLAVGPDIRDAADNQMDQNTDGTAGDPVADVFMASATVQAVDLSVTNLAVAQASLQSGGAVTVRWNDLNTGSAATTGGWYDRVRVVNTTTGATLVDVLLHHSATLAAGTSDAREYSFILPDGTSGAGDLEITVTADASGSVYETNPDGTAESNNSATITKSSALAPYPDPRPLLDAAKSPAFAIVGRGTPVAGSTAGSILVSSLIDDGGALSNFSSTSGGLPGIALTGVNLSGGRLWFSTDAGASWKEVGPVTDTFATLLAADAATRLFFAPATGFSGSIADVISFRAWDRSGGFTNGFTGVNTQIDSPFVGRFDTSGNAWSVTLSADGRYAYVADLDAGLQIIDVANPASPIRVGGFDTSGGAWGVTLSADGRYAYVADDSAGLQILDVANPASPSRVGGFDTSGYATSVTLSTDGRYAYVADYDAGLQIIDVSNPASPSRVGGFDTSGYARSVTLSSDGRYAYVADESAGLQILDVANPASPSRVGGFDTSGYAWGVTLSADGRYAYVADYDAGLQIIDVSNPASPSRVGGFDTSSAARSVTLSADGRYAYVADDYAGLQIVDVTNPSRPSHVSGFDSSGNAVGVTLSADGRYAYVADYGAGLQILDVSNPSSNIRVGGFNTSGNAWSVTLSADGRYAYVADDSAGLQILNIVNPSSPVRVGGFDTSGLARSVALTADGRYAYVADESAGLQILDVANPASPSRVGGFDTSGYALSVTLSADGRYAYVADDFAGLQILDVANPASPSRVGGFDTSGYAISVTLSTDGRYAYVADWNAGLQILDVADPASPSRVGGFDTSGNATSVTLSTDGRYAFVADYEAGLLILDVSNPASPSRVGGFDTSGNARSVTLSADGRYAYVADDSTGLQILDVANPSSPIRVDGFDTSGYALGVTLSADGRYAYVADYDAGLQILDATIGRPAFSLASDTASAFVPSPDLSVTGLAVAQASLQSGGAVTVRWNDLNTGSAATTGGWHDRVRVVNTTTGATLVDVLLHHSATLAAGTSDAREYSFILPDGTSGAGDLEITVTADASSSVYETNADGTAETNNSATITKSSALAPYPDLSVTGLAVAQASLQSGGLVTINWNDVNNGNAATNAGWHDRIRVVNTTTGATLVDVWIHHSTTLAAGGSTARQYSFNLPDGTSGAGDLAIGVTADIGNTLYEYNPDGTAETNNSATITKSSALAPYPDLSVTGLAVAQASLQSGGAVTVRWNDLNTGSAATTGGWHDRVRVVNNTTGATLVDVLLLHSATLAAGTSDAREYSFNLPDGTSGAGDLEITVTADSSSSVYESNPDGTAETNNSATITKSSALAPYPDLSVTGLAVAQASLQSGGAVTVRWNDLNTGAAATTGGWHDRVRVVNTTTGATLVDVLVLSSRVLDAGGTLGREYAFTLPDGSAGAGDLTVTVTADTYGHVYEYAADGTGETNNTASIARTSTVAPYADLAVSGITAPASALPGETVTVHWTVTNNGTATASSPWSDRVFLSSDATLGDDRWLASLSFDGTLAAGASVTREMQVTIPVFVGGNVRFVVETGVGRSFYEPGTADNVAIAAAPTSVAAALQLAVSRIRISEGDGASAATATVSRNGDTSADLVVDLATSLPAGVGIPSRVTIPAGQASVQFAVAAIDDAISQGPRAFSIAASAAGFVDAAITGTLDDDDVARLAVSIAATSVAENAANPAVTATVTRNTPTTSALVVKLQSDNPSRASCPATVTIPAGAASVTFPITVVDNTAIDGSSRVSFTATAEGLAGAGSSVVVTDDDVVSLALLFRATTVTEGEGSPATIGTVTRAVVTGSPLTVTLLSSVPGAVSIPATVTIPANAASVSFTVNAPDNALATGARSVVIAAQPTTSSGVVLDNGTASGTLTVLDNDGPTLVVTATTVSVREGATIEGRVIRNTPADADLVVTLASSDTGEAVVPATVTIPAGADSVTFPIRGAADGIADRTQVVSITASAAAFNTGSFPVLVTDADLPDLRVTAVAGPATAKAGAPVTITWTVVNDGVVAATGSWVDRIYLSTDDQLGDDVLVGSLTFTGSLAVGESTTRTQTFTMPSNLGTYRLLAVTDGPALATAGVITTGFVAEGSETNNVSVSDPITLTAAYRAEARVALDVSPQGAPVTITGRAFDPESGSAAAGVPVTVRIAVKGTRRLLDAVTGDDGTFTAVFQPLANEAGSYTVCADHPGITADTVQDSFRIYGMRANYSAFNVSVTAGSPVTGTLTISNLGDLPLTGVTVEATDLPANVAISSRIESSIAAGASVPLEFTVTSLGEEPALSQPFLRIRSTEGADYSFPLNITVLPFHPRLVASVGLLERGMLRGEQTIVTFDVTNLGGAEATDVFFNLPDFSWMKVVSPAAHQTLAVGETMRVTLALSPAADLPLEAYVGTIGVSTGNDGVSVPFSFRAISEAVGDLTVNVVDENTYYVAGAPQVAGARVALLDPYDSSKVIAEATTDADGRATFSGVPEAIYMIDVQAPKHGQYRQPVTLHAGITNAIEAFVPLQTVTYSWTVTPTEIVDNYSIRLETTFETNVPAPVVELGLPSRIPDLAPGESTTIMARITNKGWIAAEDCRFDFPEHPEYLLSALVVQLGVLPAKSEINVPITITRRIATSGLDGGPTLERSLCGDVIAGLRYLHYCPPKTPREHVGIAVMGIPISWMACTLTAFGDFMSGVSGSGSGSGSGNRDVIGRSAGMTIGYGCSPRIDLGELEAGPSAPTVSAASDNGVCARVKLALDQQATLTRSAFNGELTLNNGSSTGDLTGVQVTLDFRDSDGKSVNERFFVQPARLSGISAVDGTGIVSTGTTGTAQYTIIPTRIAAPDAPTTYSVGGTLRYIDPDSGQEVVVPLLGASITVYPDPNLQLDYFWQRDVYGDDPHTEEVEPSEPFAVGLIVSNTGHGTAKDFTITSAQPKIIENEKGLLVDFSILGTQVDVNPVAPSLTANFGTIGAGESVVGQWLMTSTLQGKFIEFAASFTHDDALGGKATSLIDTVNIHELIRSVRVGGDGDDGRPDFLVNDVADPDHLPDTLWLSNGSKAPVSVATDISVDRAMAGGRLVATVTAAPVSGWAYAAIPDAPAGYRLDSVTRSDGTLLAIGKTAWQTDRTFPASTSAAVRERLVHLLDRDATGTWTLSYVVDDRIAPVLLSIGDVDPNPRSVPVDSIDVTFSEAIDPATFTAADLSLSRDGGANLVDGNVTITHVSGGTYRIGGLSALTTADGVYEVTVVGAGVKDWGGNAATGTVARRWANGAAGPYVVSLAAPSGSGAPVDTVEVTFSAAVDPATFSLADLSLARDGGANLLDDRVVIDAVSATTFRIHGLSGLTGDDGRYTLSVRAAGVTGGTGLAGVGSLGLDWIRDTLRPTVAAVQQPATNPRNIVVPSLDVTFSEPVDLASFTRDDLFITRDGVPVATDSRVTIQALSATTFRIAGFTWFVGQEGTYRFSVSAEGILDLAGNVGTGSAAAEWVMDTTAPSAPTSLRIEADTGASAADGVTTARTMTLRGMLGEPGLTVEIRDIDAGVDLGKATVTGTEFSKEITLAVEGRHRIRIRLVDAAGNVGREARDMKPGGYFDVVIDRTAPTLLSIETVATSPRTTPIDTIDVELSEEIDGSTLDWRDVVLTRDDGANLVTDAVTVERLSGNTWRVGNLDALTADDGEYRLTVVADGVADVAGNAGRGSVATAWITDGGGSLRRSSLTGNVFHDHAGDRKIDEGDEGLAGWTVFIDTDGNGVANGGEPSATTAADGSFRISGLAAGTHTVIAVAPNGWTQSLPAVVGHGQLADVVSGGITGQVDFGFYRAGRIEGTLFDDRNRSGARDPGEPGVAGWTVYLDLNADGQRGTDEPAVTTGGDGGYVFTDLAPGTYAVTQVYRDQWTQTSPGTDGGNVSGQQAAATLATGNLAAQSFVIFDQRCACVAGKPTTFATGAPVSADGSAMAWADADPSTPNVIDVWYDFRGQNGWTNTISTVQIELAEKGLQLWEGASGGAIHFIRNPFAPASDIINIGVGNLAALGGTSGPRNVLGLGGAVFAPLSQGGLRSGVAWLDFAENWDNTFGNGNVAGSFDFFTTVSHEIGHALGIEHATGAPADSLMHGIYGGERTTFAVADSMAVRELYAGCGVSIGGQGGWTVTPVVLPGTHVVTVFSGSVIYSQDFGNASDNAAPTSVSLANAITAIAENTSTVTRLKVADIVIADDTNGTNVITLSGADAASFEVDGTELFVKAGVVLNYEQKASYSVTVRVSDASVAGSTPVTVDYTLSLIDVDETPATPVVTLSRDTGSSDTDRVTSIGLLDITAVIPAAKIEYSVNGGTQWTDSFAAVEGANSVLVRQSDADGNTSRAAELAFILDTIAPAAPSASLFNDTGFSTTDLVTKDGRAIILFPERDYRVEVRKVGTVDWALLAAGTSPGNAPVTLVSLLPALIQGRNDFVFRVTDLAGNISSDNLFGFAYDNVAPSAPVARLSADTGISATDRITTIGTLVAATPFETGAKVEYRQTYPTTQRWTSAFVPSSGPNAVEIRQTDRAGNVSETSLFSFTLDSSAATITGITLPTAGNYSAGQTLTFSVTFSETVYVKPYNGPAALRVNITPYIELTIGGVKRRASYQLGSGTNTLVFSYKIQNGDKETGANGIGIASLLSLNAGNWIADAAGNNSSLSFASKLPTTLPRIRIP